MRSQRIVLFLLPVILFLVAACGGRGASQSAAAPTDEPTKMPAAAPEAPTEPPPAETAAPAADADQTTPAITTAEEASSIQSFRMRISMQSDSARGANDVLIEGEFTKEPAAERLVMQIRQGESQMEAVETIRIGDTRYVQAQGMWIQAPEAAPNIDELTIITPEDVTGILERMERVGEEVVNDRQTVHYRGDNRAFPVVSSGSDTFDASQVEMAQLDLWVDQAENFITRMTVTASGDVTADGGTEEMQFALQFDYYDINADISIETPENAMDMDNLNLPALPGQ